MDKLSTESSDDTNSLTSIPNSKSSKQESVGEI